MRLEAAGGVGHHQHLGAEQGGQADREDRLVRAVALVGVQAPLVVEDRPAGDRLEHLHRVRVPLDRVALEGEEEVELDRPVRPFPQVHRQPRPRDHGHLRTRPAQQVEPLHGGLVLLDEGLQARGGLLQRVVDQPFQVFGVVHGRLW